MANISASEVSLNVGSNHKNCEIPIRSSHELEDDKIVCDAKEVVGETKVVEHLTRSSEEIDRTKCFFVLETCENKETIKDDMHIESTENKDEVGLSNSNKLAKETNNLALYQKVENEKKTSHSYDENGYEKRFSEALGLLENKKQEVLEH